MRNLIIVLILFQTLFLTAQVETIHHDLQVSIVPETSGIEVEDVVKIPASLVKKEIYFSMNATLKIVGNSDNIKVKLMKEEVSAQDIGMDRDDAGESAGSLKLDRYRIKVKHAGTAALTFKLKYKGIIESPIEQSEENYQRGFSESPGIIADLGIYLAGSTYWVPQFEDKMVTFTLNTTLPAGWKTVSQGGRTLNEDKGDVHVDVWQEMNPQEEIFLIGARFEEYNFSIGNVMAMAFLRTPDEALANKYLETTAQYLEMYRQLVGPYPYSKFALVENFWETGYGMPSFTLLGEKIIRFPFILHSSYPHELLHNWWGNSVYIDFDSGNWCEGLTAYMADHLIKEQRGQGDAYRRTTIQKFTDYVTPENDFAVNRFISRHNSSSEAIGYGKVSMLFHMLRQLVGDENFVKGMQHFNRNNAFRKASFSDIRKSFEIVSGKDLKSFFEQWTSRKGAPKLVLSDVEYDADQVSFTLKQVQSDDVFELNVPVLLSYAAGETVYKLRMKNREQNYTLAAPGEISRLEVDLMYDVFRILDPNEVPSTLSKAYGAKETIFVLPSLASEEEISWYKQFVVAWAGEKLAEQSLRMDKDLSQIPKDKTVWILGFENSFANDIFENLKEHKLVLSDEGFAIGEKSIDKEKSSSIITTKHPGNVDEVFVFLSIEKAAAIAGLVRKLPHYGKYSYLAFEGDEPVNMLKGQWEVLHSPLMDKNKNFNPSDDLGEDSELVLTKKTDAYLNRKALAYLAPVFSAERIMKDVRYLASEEMKGRGLGTPELDLAADFIKMAFESAGLQPGGENGTYLQTWEHSFKDKGKMKLQNIIGIIPGSDPNFANSPVVVSAHYDHLGLGWPDVQAGNIGKIHYGADDNASGVGIMIELARNMAKSTKPVRPIIFVAFTAEESGLLGSRYFVKKFNEANTGAKLFANLNLDSNGRLFDNPLLILNGNTAREWKFIFMGTDYVTGIKTELIQQELDASDQLAFNEVGVPAVQLFSGATRDYHKPGDIVEKLDPAGMVKVATVAKEVIQYLGERREAMPYTGKPVVLKKDGAKAPIATQKTRRKASTGSMPDFRFTGMGVRIASVSEDSPAEEAGLQAGDVIIAFDSRSVKNLVDYSNELKKYNPGDKVVLEIIRGAEKLKKEIVLGER